MEVGDSYYCIKTLLIKENKNSPLEEFFIKGKFYKAVYITKYHCYINSHIVNNWGTHKNFTFTIVKGGKYYFSDYFAYIKKLRKEKINQIYELH
jgi:hypothetical protein